MEKHFSTLLVRIHSQDVIAFLYNRNEHDNKNGAGDYEKKMVHRSTFVLVRSHLYTRETNALINMKLVIMEK